MRGARSSLKSAIRVVPVSRMKSRKEHRVPRSSAALVVLERTDGLRPGARLVLVPSRRTNPYQDYTWQRRQPMSPTLRPMTGTLAGQQA